MSIFNIISMLGGLALFLYGMRIMGDGLKKGSTGSFKKALEKVTNSPVLGFLIGLSLTALIQSATATIVIVSGLVGAGIMTLNQSIGIILGANVGTTATGQIIRLMDIEASDTSWLNLFKPATLAPLAAIVGIIYLMFLSNKKNSNTIGTIAIGFGILFTGLMNMSAAVEPLSSSPQFMQMFSQFGEYPILGFLIGFGVAFILQSSSATIGILQALSVTGALTLHSVYPMIAGIYLGDCLTTAIVCSIGSKPDAKRTGIVNILFNLSEIVLITIGMSIVHATGILDSIWDVSITSGGIANTHTIFNLSCALILLPVCKLYAKIACKIVKDAPKDTARTAEIEALDEALFKSPALALNSSYKAIMAMQRTVSENISLAVGNLSKFDDKLIEKFEEDEDFVDSLQDNLNVYLAKLSPFLGTGKQEAIQNYYLKTITDIERAGDHVYSVACCSGELHDKQLSFSESAVNELDTILEMLSTVANNATLALEKQNLDAAKAIQPYVETISLFADKSRDAHVERMRTGECDPVTGSIFLDVLMHLNRVAEMYSNIGIHTLARHNQSEENYEHVYMATLRHGDNEEFNNQMKILAEKYLN